MRCSFCSFNMQKGTGKMFVKSNGEIFYWCSSKCKKSFLMGRSKKKIKWAKKQK